MWEVGEKWGRRKRRGLSGFGEEESVRIISSSIIIIIIIIQDDRPRQKIRSVYF